MIHESEDLPVGRSALEEMANPQALQELGDFFILLYSNGRRPNFYPEKRRNVMSARPVIRIQPENCRGCRSCEAACVWHDPVPFNPRRAGIHIMRLDNAGIDYPVINTECQEQFCGKISPESSRQDEPACVTACLFNSLTLQEEGYE